MTQELQEDPLKQPAMRLVYHPECMQHDTGRHPENIRRLEAFSDLPAGPLIDGRPFLELVHTPEYIRQVEQACRLGTGLDPDTPTSAGSFAAACHAVGATMHAAQEQAFALVRPPGHHAFAGHGSGFCLFNNVAVATQHLLNQGKRVLIFDFDGHLGDGTSDIFYESNQVMYWSVHQYPAFPGNGFVDEIGSGKGEGFTINIPLPPGSADDIFMDAIEHTLPIAKQFQPDIVAVSAGFDAHQLDPLLQLLVSTESFYKIGKLLRENFDRVFAVLEGGYDIPALKSSVFSFLNGFNLQPYQQLEEHTISGFRVWETYEINLHAALGRLGNFWKLH